MYGIGQIDPVPPPVRPVNWPIVLGWTAALGVAYAIFSGTINLKANRRTRRNGGRSEHRRSSNREVGDLIHAARSQGWQVMSSSGGHWIFRPPDKSMPQIIVAGTPGSGNRSLDNAKSKLKRAGLVMNRKRLVTNRNEDDGWHEVGRFDTGWRAFNRMIASQMQALSNTMGRVETLPSRSRPGKISYAVFLKFIDGPKQSLDFLESQYVQAHDSLRANRRRRSSRRRTSRR